MELDSNKEKLRQKEGWHNWVVSSQQESSSESSTPLSATYPSSAGTMMGGGGAQEFSVLVGTGVAGDSPLLSTAPSEASDSVVVSVVECCGECSNTVPQTKGRQHSVLGTGTC